MESTLVPLLKGFLTGAGLIVAIGAQNAFVLKQGLLRNHVFITALFCSAVDALLIAAGVGGLGFFFQTSPILLGIAKWGGAAFLAWYGFRAFRRSFMKEHLHAQNPQGVHRPGLKQTIALLAVFSLLNPHVYLDTVVILGSVGSQFVEHERPLFAAGAMTASFSWFFALAYGARLLAPIFDRPLSWKILDGIIGCVMWAIAISLLLG